MANVTPTIRAVYSAQANATTCSITTTGSGGTLPVAGDTVIAFHTNNVSTLANMSTPTGGLTWTLVDSSDAGSALAHNKAWSATLGSGGNFTVTANNAVSGFTTLHVFVIAGSAGVNAFGHNTSVNATTVAQADGVTTTVTNTLLLLGMSVTNNTGITTDASGYTRQSLQQVPTTHMAMTYSRNVSATGATGLAQTTLSAAKASIASISLALTPANTSTTDTPATASASMVDPTVVGQNTLLPYRVAVLADSPTGYYELLESSGTSFTATSGPRAAALGTSAVLNQAGPVTGYKSVKGVSAFAFASTETSSTHLLNTSPWSMECWFKAPTDSTDKVVMYAKPPGASASVFDVRVFASGGMNVRFGSLDQDVLGVLANDDTWHHLVVTTNGSNGMKLYFDGVQKVGASYSGVTVGSGSGSNTYSFGSTTGNPIYIAQPAWYSTELTSTRVTAHKNAMSSISYSVTATTASGLIVMPAVTAARAVNYAVTPMTASSTLPAPVVGTGWTVSTTPATGSSLMVAPVVTATSTVNYAATPMLGSALMTNVIFPNVNFRATPATASASLVTPGIVLGSPATIAVPPMAATAGLISPVGLRDRYRQLLDGQTDFDDIYYRFAETSGTDAINEVLKRSNGVGKQGTYYGGPLLGQIGAPGGLPYVRFDGINDYLQTELLGGGTGTPTGSLEILFRTTGDNMALFYGTEDTGGTTNIGYGDSVEIRNGRIYIRRYTTFAFGSQWIDIGGGFGVVNDGQWHHVVITNWWYTATGSASWEDRNDYNAGATDSLSIYIDGKLDRRYDRSQMPGNTAARMAIPDIVGRPVDSRVGWFAGDIATLVGRRGYSIPKYWIEQNSYAALDVLPIFATPMQASATIPNVKARGNSIRVLYLDFLPISNHGGTVVENGRITDQVNAISDPNNAAGWRNPITAERTLINLSNPEHVRIENYDLIYLADNLSVQGIKGQLEISTQKAQSLIDDFFANVKQAVVTQGVSWFIKQPEHAKRAGLIKNYVVEETVYETKGIEFDYWRPFAGQLGSGLLDEYDYWAWFNDPWRNRTSNVYNNTSRNPYWYVDTHNAYKQRVVALEAGLTDTLGWTLAEQIQLHYPDPFTRGGADSALRYDENISGLRLGQEVIPPLQRNQNGGPPSIAGSKLIGVADSDINAGTVIARGAANDYINETITNNPYADLATVIVIKEGDLVDGVATTGRIFMGFVDDYNETAFFPAGIPNVNETELQKQWQTSTFRGGGGYTIINVDSGTVQGTTPNNPNIPLPSDSQIPRPASSFYMWNPADQPYRLVPNGSFGRRGYVWLTANKLIPALGDRIVKVPAMTAEVRIPAPANTTQQNVAFKVTPMVGTAKFQQNTNFARVDTEQLVPPMLANAIMAGLLKRIAVEPMLATANFPGSFGSARTIDDRINLTFDRVNTTIILYIRSDK
jgi:hypothetical protein